MSDNLSGVRLNSVSPCILEASKPAVALVDVPKQASKIERKLPVTGSTLSGALSMEQSSKIASGVMKPPQLKIRKVKFNMNASFHTDELSDVSTGSSLPDSLSSLDSEQPQNTLLNYLNYQLVPGDIVFFHVDKKRASIVERIIRLGNSINRQRRGLNHSAVHVEIVTGHDENGNVILQGIPGRGKALREDTLANILEIKKGRLTAISVARPKNVKQRHHTVEQAYQLAQRDVGYSVLSCAVAALPFRKGIDACTSKAQSMMCSELVVNIYRAAGVKHKGCYKVPKSRVSPGLLRAYLDKKNSGFIVTNAIPLDNGDRLSNGSNIMPSWSNGS